MGWDGIWRLTDPPMSGDQVAALQGKALRGFSSYAVPFGVVVNGVYDRATSVWVAEYQRRKNASGYRPTLPANPGARPGDCDFATKAALGLVANPAVGPISPPVVAYSVAGTWAGWNDGPPAWTCWLLDPRRFYQQGVGYPAMGFLQPDPMVSYNESRDAGVAEMLRLALPDPRPKVPIGYSQGADVVTRFLYAWPADRRGEIAAVIKFGDPGHSPGVQGSTYGGISRVFTPDWCAGRTRSYQISGDMYGDAPGLLPFFYDILTRMDVSGEFVFYLFGLLTGIPVGGFGLGAAPSAPPNLLGEQLLGLSASPTPLAGAGALSGLLGLITPGPLTQTGGPISLAAMLLNLPALIRTLLALLKFVSTNAHFKYGGAGSAPVFDGVDAVINAANLINALTI